MSDAFHYVIDPKSINGDDIEDTKLLREMARQAELYVHSFGWCLEFREGVFSSGIGGIIALFRFRVSIHKSDVPEEWIWVFVGDVPSAYLEAQGFNTPHAALEHYVEGLGDWVAAARAGEPLDDLIPIKVEPSPEAIEMIEARISSLRELVLPQISNTVIQ